MKCILVLLASVLLASATSSDNTVRMCVPKDKYQLCEQMLEESASLGVDFKCVQGADRQDCVDKIFGPFTFYQMSPQADIMFAEPEDLLLAYQKSNSTFRAFAAVRTKEEPESEFRYESVAVVPADSPVKSLSDLKGLKSCHTGVGRNAGYKIPFTILSKMGVMKADDDPTLSARESELKAFSQFFSKACIVGTWSSHADVNSVMKDRYSNLCAMCEKPDQCDYPDKNSGYDGALRCLADSGGDVAFTKVIVVKKFFGLPHGLVPAQETSYDYNKYRYLCPDGTKKPLDGPACVWAARPWPTWIANKKFTGDDIFAKLRDDLQKLAIFGENKQSTWRKDVLGLEDHNTLKDIEPIAPLQYLKRARYYDVLTRQQEFGPFKAVRLCEVIQGFFSTGKCEKLSSSAFSRGVRPRIECVNEDSIEKCLDAVKSNRADAVFADPHDAYHGIQDYNLRPLMVEKYGNLSTQYLAVVVPKESSIQSLKDFKEKRMCFWTNKKSEYDTALEVFVENGLITKNCPYSSITHLGSYGSQTCLTAPLVTVGGKPLFDDGMMRPFVPTLGRDVDHYHPEDKFELLCPQAPHKSTRMPLTAVEMCNFGIIPPRMMLVKQSINQLQIDELIAMFTSIGDIYNKNPDYFRLFGDFNMMPDVMFSNTATGFEKVSGGVPHWKEYTKLMENIKNCKLGVA